MSHTEAEPTPFSPGFPGDYPIRPANLLQLDWRASTRNMINIWLPEAIGCSNLGSLLFILHEDVDFRFSRNAEGHWQHSYLKPGVLELTAVTRPLSGGVELTLSVLNLSTQDWQNVSAAVCVQFHAAPDFHDPSRQRTFYPVGGQLRAMSGPVKSIEGNACRFYGSRRLPEYPAADHGFMAIASEDGQHTAAMWWQGAVDAWGNAHPATLCMHTDPRLGDIPAGQSRSCLGRLYLMRGSPQAALERCRREQAELNLRI